MQIHFVNKPKINSKAYWAERVRREGERLWEGETETEREKHGGEGETEIEKERDTEERERERDELRLKYFG